MGRFEVRQTPRGILVGIRDDLTRHNSTYLPLIDCRNDAAFATGNGPDVNAAYPYAPSFGAAEKWAECAETFAVTRGLS